MSKEKHTPKYIIQEFRSSVDIWDIDGQKCICSNFCLPETKKDSKEKMEFVLNILNNHGRLVEALQKIVNAEEGHELFLLIEEAEQLITELNSSNEK